MTPVEWASLVVAVAWLIAAGAVGVLAAVLVADGDAADVARTSVDARARPPPGPR
jgi:hypothetical protein